MADSLAALFHHAESRGARTAFLWDGGAISYADLAERVRLAAAWAAGLPPVVGLLGRKDVDWVVADLALTLAGKTLVPLPEFFSPAQLGFIAADCGIGHIVTGAGLDPMAAALGLPHSRLGEADGPSQTAERGTRIIYTSGTTGRPKGVRLGFAQVAASAGALARVTAASVDDRVLSVLPFSLLLEQVAGIHAPLLTGASVAICGDGAEALARGDSGPVDEAAREARATVTVLVPDMLAAWVAGLRRAARQAPPSLRFAAVGGAPVPAALADEAWRLGLPVHEGYGLSECCSVVAVNRPGERVAGTVGRPIAGVEVVIDDGEIVVGGPTVMLGYLGGEPVRGRWRTGDLGSFDGDGRLIVTGRKDELIVTTLGRNISPEWIETMISADDRVGRCAVVDGGAYPAAVLVPSAKGESWFARADDEAVLALLARLCREAPDYARPRRHVVASEAELRRLDLITPNGRLRRRPIARALDALARSTTMPVA